MKNYLLVNRALAAEKNINYFNNLFSRVKEHSSPTVNRRSTDGQSQRQYTIGIWKYVAMIFAVLVMSVANVGTAWGKYLYLSTANHTSWENDEAIFKLYPGTGSDIAGTKIYDHMYRFDVTAVSTSSNAMYFKRYKKDGSTKWNEFSVTYNATYNTYKVTGWDAGSCANSNLTEIYLDVHNEWYKDSPIFKLTTGGTTYVTTGFAGTNLVIFSIPSPSGTLQFERWSSDNKTKWNQLSTTYNSSYNAYEVASDIGSVYASYNVKIVDKPNYIYFDNSQIAFGTSNAYVVVGHDKPTAYSSTYAFGTKPIPNTKLYYYNNTGNTWRDATYYAFLQNSSSFGGGSWGSSNLSAASKYTAAYTTATDLSWDKMYLFVPASGSNGASLTLNTYSAASDMNSTQTIKYAISIDNGSSYTELTSGKTLAQLQISAYKFTDAYNSVSNSSNSQTLSANSTTYSASVPAGYTGKTTLSYGSVQTGYTFVDWADGPNGSTITSPYYPTGEKTVYARFKATQVTVTLNKNSGTGGTASVKATYGVGTLPSITNPTRSDYEFAGWFTGSGGTGKLVIDIDGSLQPGISGFTDADGKWIATSNKNVYAGWLTVHSPGAYTDTYGQALTIANSAQYEVYRYAVNSSTIYVNAGGESAPITTSDPRNLFSFSQSGTSGACDYTWSEWIGHTQTYGKDTETATASGEFKAHSVCQPKCRNQQGFIICVTGYSEFSIYAKDNATSGGENFKVFINGANQSMTLSKSWTVRRFALTPANTYVIRVTGQTDSNNQIQGFSLKVPCPAYTLDRGGQENGTYTVGSYDGNALTCTPSASGTYTYQWKQYTSGQGVGDTINAVGSGANTNSFTPNPASAGTYYYMCRVLNVCGDKQVTSTTGTFVFSAAPSCSAPDAPTISGTADYIVGQTLTLTASCESGADASTTYTWYKGDTWGSKSQVQAAAVAGSNGNKYTKTAAVGDAGTYWCEASNGSGCEAHNSTGKAVTVVYKVTYNNNGGSGTISNSTGTSITLSNGTGFTAPDGYTFDGWNTAADGSGTGYTSGQTGVTANLDLYARWKQTVTIDDQGGSKDGSVVVYYNGTAGTPTAPTYAGHTPDLGYYAESGCATKVMNLNGSLVSNVTDGSSVAWTNSSGKWIKTGSSKLYAHWKCDAPTITDNGDNTVSISVPSGTTVRYTTDGTTPSSSVGTEYSSAFDVVSNCTVKAVAYQTGCTDSEVASRSITPCTPVFGSVTFDNNKSEKHNTSYNTSTDVEVIGTASWTQSGVSSDTGHKMTKPAMKLDNTDDYIKITLPSGITSGTITIQACTYEGDAGTLIINDENNSTTPLASAEVGQKDSKAYYMVNSPDGGSWTDPTLQTLTYSSISAGGDFYIKKSSGANIYVYAFSATSESACPKPTITATRLTAEYMPTGSSGVQIGVEVTGASSGWKYRVKNKNGGYEAPDNNTYSTSTWTMTSTIGTGANTYKVELYDNSATPVKKAVSSVITVHGEVAYPMTISAGDGGSISPTSTQANGAGDHLHPTITATPSDGYHFVNWTLSNSNATLDDEDAATTTITSASGACTITANFAVDGYTVTYADGGATGDVPVDASSPYEEGATVTVLDKGSLAKTGYSFAGWNDGSTDYEAGDTFTMPDKDVTLTAQWTVNTYDVTHSLTNMSTTSGSTGSNAATYGTNYSAELAADDGYTLPTTITVTAGATDITANCTWNSSTGAVSIPGSYITGNITITAAGVSSCPTGGDVFTLEMTYSGSEVSVAANTVADWSASYGTKDGGDVKFGNVNGSSAGKIKIQANQINLGSNDGYIKLILDCPLKQNDVLSFTSSNNYELCFTTDDSYDNSVKSSSKKWTVPKSFNNVSTIYIWRASSNTNNIYTINIVRPVTVTFDKNGGSSVSPSSATYDGTSSSVLASATRTDYHLDGWNTKSDGSGDDLGLPGETYYLDDVTTSTTTIYAQWSAKSCASGTIYQFTVNTGLTNDNFPKTTEVYVKTSDYLATMTGGYLKAYNSSSDKLKITDTKYICINSSSSYLLVQLDCPLRAGDQIKSTVKSQALYITKGSDSRASTYSLPVADNNVQTIPAAWAGATEIKIWAGSSNGGKIQDFQIIRAASTYNVTYDDNDATSGSVPTDATDYDYNAEVTVKGNSGTLAMTNYATLAYWNTKDDGSGTDYAIGSGTFNITDNTTLYAKWTQAVTLNKNGGTTDGNATAVWNATGLTSFTAVVPASGYKCSGYYTTASGEGVKVLNSDGSFAASSVTDYVTSGKWSRTGAAPTLYARYEASGSIKWNLQVNSADAPIVTSSKNSSYTQISTSNMTNLDSIGLNITASKKASMTSKITAPTAFDKDRYMKVTFQVASGYQFKPSSIKVPIQPVDGGADVKLVLVDNAATPDSIGKMQSSLSKGTLTTVEMTNSSAVFKGTVTLKIYCYGSSTGTYRLGTPIQIDGEIESTCTMPSYESVSYSQTEYIKDASASAISVVGASGDPSYQWKYNSTGDRTSGTNCGTDASVTPSMESTGTLYYWCELTNACGTVKTPAVAITVSASKSTATVTWTDPSTPNYGGGGYTIKATVNEAWNGNASDLVITAPAGIRIYDKTSGTDGSGKKYVQVKFDVQTALDRSTYEDKIPFTVSADATTSYNAISADHNVSYSACSGGGGSATEELMPVDDEHMDNSTWKGGWVYDGIGMMRYGHGSSDIAAGKDNANLTTLTYKMESNQIDTYYKSSANHFGFYTEKAITGIRLYVYTSNDNVTVSGIYVGNSAFGTSTPSSGAVSYEAEYNDDNDALRSGTHSGSAWVDITFASEVAAGKYGQINLSKNVNIAGMAFISASESGASLTTTLSFASSSVTKAQSDANFTITPTKGDYSETLGAITYSSSNTDCATVNATTGEVTITATGSSNLTSRITATLAASGCYKSATAYYDLTVTGQECTITSAGTLSADKTVKCSGANVTLTLSGEDDGMTVTWYRDATNVTTSVSDHTLTTSAAGSYSVVVSNATCSKRSNSITISNYSAEVAATKIVDKWYIKHGRVTPDIALWALDEGTHLDSVTWSTTNATGLTIADFYESDGVVYLSGKEPNTNESSDAEYTLTLRVKDECENKTLLNTSAKQITLIHQKNTDKHVLAFVVEGTAKGGFTAGISADQTTGVELYNEIAKTFDVQATNIYSTDDEQKLKEYYSQFDILCITDYPNTKTKGVNSKSYVDAIGALVDIRPILTMEAWVSGLTNWKSKGISGTPKSPTTRQYSMLLQCKDHEIFSGTNPTTVGSGDETMYRIDMVDKTMEEYATLDATYGAGAHESDKNYQYGKKPALQGFTYDASMSSLLPIGRIDDGEGNDLEVGVERQAVMEARLLVLGINGYAMERLDDDGMTIVINALKYLMKKNAEDISDCSNYFVGGAEGDPYSWKNLDNWSGSTLPDRTQEVRIVAPCVISDTIARASSVKIVTGGTYSHGTKTANGSLTINPTGSLIVDGKIYAATAPKYFEKRATEPENLVVKADADHTGTLIFDNEDGETQATIEMYSPSHWEVVAGKYVKYWSYVGMPIKDVHIPDYFYGAFTYYFNEAKGWEKRFDNDIMQPFEGIGLSMQAGHKETFYGTMVSTENTDITITNHTGYGDGDNLIGNSWTAPIQIANFDADDFGSCWATVYIFNTGKGGNTYVNASADNDGAAKAGQWLGVPIGVAALGEYTGLKVIPAMNAFLVHDTVSSSTTLHLDYDKLVREDAVDNAQINEKMRAPRKKKDVEGLLRIRVVGEKTNTDVWMLQDPRFSEGFDNGWEAYYNPCDDRSAQLYARSAIGAMCFLALPDLDGTTLGFAPSRDGNDYTFTFQYRGEDEYYLNDLKLQQSVLIDADNTYDFTYEKGDANRFYISRTPLQAPQNPTDVENTSDTPSPKAIKVIYNDKLYIINGGRVYSADGMLVK